MACLCETTVTSQWHHWCKGACPECPIEVASWCSSSCPQVCCLGQSILRKQKHGCFLKWWDIPPNNPILIGFSIILTIHFGVFLYFRKTQFLRKSLMSNVIVFHHLDSPQLGFATLRCWWKAGEPNVWPPKRWDLMVMNPMGSQSVKKSSKKQMQA